MRFENIPAVCTPHFAGIFGLTSVRGVACYASIIGTNLHKVRGRNSRRKVLSNTFSSGSGVRGAGEANGNESWKQKKIEVEQISGNRRKWKQKLENRRNGK